MSNSKKLLQAAAGAAGDAALDIPDVFSTYLYEGTGSAKTITNGIDLSGEGGLVWVKRRSITGDHQLHDSERGATYRLELPARDAQYNSSGITSFNADGFSLSGGTACNVSGEDHVSWTFRKAPKFFDIQTWSGTSSTRTISHNLGCTPGMIVIKSYDSNSTDWMVWHNGFTNTSTKLMYLNTTDQEFNYGNTAIAWGNTAPTSTEFTVGAATMNNETGKDYVAYIFAHNNNDGEFGPDQDQDIIKCGAYTGNGDVLDVNLGFEAGWVLVKRRDSNGTDWHLFDEMRGMPFGTDASWLETNTTAAEANNQYMAPTPTGFRLPAGHPEVNADGDGYIYMAIRRGFLNTPEDATEVFNVTYGQNVTSNGGLAFNAGFPVDFFIRVITGQSGDRLSFSRLTGSLNFLKPNLSAASGTTSVMGSFDSNEGIVTDAYNASSYIAWLWKRAPNYFDVVAYTGNSTAGRTVSHNLGVAPEMMWIKQRDSTNSWFVYHKDLGNTYKLSLDTGDAAGGPSNGYWNSTSPSSTTFTLGTFSNVNASGGTYIAYLFASTSGVSKVGSYTGINDLQYQTIDCGFTNGARFVLLKRWDSTGNWYLFDSVRGITTTANDPFFELDTTEPEATETSKWNSNVITSHSSGFRVVNDLNISGVEYIFYAIA